MCRINNQQKSLSCFFTAFSPMFKALDRIAIMSAQKNKSHCPAFSWTQLNKTSGRFWLMIILDTNVISELMRDNPAAIVKQWISQQKAVHLSLTTITIAEIQRGLMRLPTGKRRTNLEVNFTPSQTPRGRWRAGGDGRASACRSRRRRRPSVIEQIAQREPQRECIGRAECIWQLGWNDMHGYGR